MEPGCPLLLQLLLLGLECVLLCRLCLVQKLIGLIFALSLVRATVNLCEQVGAMHPVHPSALELSPVPPFVPPPEHALAVLLVSLVLSPVLSLIRATVKLREEV